MALAKGESRVLAGEPTLHTRTAIAVAELLLPGAQFSVTQQGGGDLWLIACEGAGWQQQGVGETVPQVAGGTGVSCSSQAI